MSSLECHFTQSQNTVPEARQIVSACLHHPLEDHFNSRTILQFPKVTIYPLGEETDGFQISMSCNTANHAISAFFTDRGLS